MGRPEGSTMRRRSTTLALAAALAITTTGGQVATADEPPPLPTTRATAVGWSAAIQHPGGSDDNRARLVMVPPSGGIIPMGAVHPDAKIQDVTPDGSYVIVSWSEGDQTHVHVWDTHEPAHYTFEVDERGAILRFGGGGIVQQPQASAPEKTFTLRGYDGQVKSSYAATKLNPGWDPETLVLPNGKDVIESADRLVVRDAASGAEKSWIRMPEVQGGPRRCEVVRPWGNGAVLVDCGEVDGDVDARYRVPLNGNEPTRLSASPKSPVWPVSKGYVYRDLDADDAPWLLRSGGKTRPLNLEAKHPSPRGSTGEELFVLSDPMAPTGGGPFYKYNVDTETKTVLVDAGAITDVQVIDGNQ